MKMSGAYLLETINHLKSMGFSVETSTDRCIKSGDVIFDRVKYRCSDSKSSTFEIEMLTYPSGRLAFFIEIVQEGRLSCTSFPLDSWKFRPKLIEFKFAIDGETSLGLAFCLALAPPENV